MITASWDPKTWDLMEDSSLSSPSSKEEEGDMIEVLDLQVRLVLTTKTKTAPPRLQGADLAQKGVSSPREAMYLCVRGVRARSICREAASAAGWVLRLGASS